MLFSKKTILSFLIFFSICFLVFGNSDLDASNDEKMVRVFVMLNDQGKNSNTKSISAAADFRTSIKEKIESKEGSSVIKEFESFDGFLAYVPENSLSELSSDPNIKSVYPDYRVHAFLQDSVPLVNATSTWKLQVGSVNLTGKGQTVCIIDTGIDTDHSDLQNNLVGQYCYCGDVPYGLPTGCCPGNLNESTSAEDDNGHGTHVAGTVAANGNIKGVAPEAKIVSIKALDYNGDGWSADVVLGIEWCISNASKFNISVISMSLGGSINYTNYCDSSDAATAAAINSAFANNISVIVAAGNSKNYTGISSPACIRNATPITATTKADVIDTTYANRNSLVALAAPGSSIYSTYFGNTYATSSGTSMATPHAAGAFAIINQYLNLSGRRYTPNQIEQVLNSTGKKINDSGYSNLNYSRIDIYSAIQSIGDISNPSIALNLPVNLFNISSTINITFNCTASDNVNITNVTLYGNWSGGWHANHTNSSAINNSNYIFIKNITDGKYVWNCRACDNSSNCAFASSNYTFTVDTTYPQVSFSSGTDENRSYVSRNWIYSNVSLTESNLRNITWDINGTKTTYNTTTNYHNQTDLGEGNFSYNVTACDYSGNCNNTGNRITVLDRTAPYFISITNQDFNYSSPFSYYINATDAFLFANYSIDDTTNFTINRSGYLKNNTRVAVGRYTINISINDSAGNYNSTKINITVKIAAVQNITANTSTNVDFSNANANLTILLNGNVNSTFIVSKETPVASGTTASLTVVKGINITSDSATSGNLSWAVITIYYTDSEISGLDESNLKIYYYNETSGNWQQETTTVNADGNYLWANVTHFSLFGAFGSAPTPGSSNTGGGGGGGGGGGSTTNNIELTRSPVTYSGLSQNTKLVFNSRDKLQHTLTINKVDTSKVDFILASDPLKFSLLVGEEKITELGSNEKLYVKVESIKTRKADITIKNIVQQKLPVIILPAKNRTQTAAAEETKTENVTNIRNQTSDTTKNNDGFSVQGTLYVVISLLVLAMVIGLFFIFKPRHKYAVLYTKEMLKNKKDHDEVKRILRDFGKDESAIKKILKKAKK